MAGMPVARSPKSIVLALAVSGSSLAAFVFFGLSSFAWDAEASPSLALEMDDALDDELYAVPVFTVPDEVEVETPLVTVPDISGLRVTDAHGMLQRVGLVLRPMIGEQPLADDDTNYWISPKQQFGQQVWAGTKVAVQVNYRSPQRPKKFARGY